MADLRPSVRLPDEAWGDLVEALTQPSAYPWQADDVKLIETHISWVFLAGDRALKLKRPVTYGFVDLSDPATRDAACEAEVTLNRRLSDDIYEGVIEITRGADGILVGGDGEVVAHGVVMQRLDQRRMLDRLIGGDFLPTGTIERVADRLAAFFKTAGPCGDDLAADLLEVVRSNLAELEPFVGETIPERLFGIVAAAMRDSLDSRGEELLARAKRGLVIDGHGDLRCEHIHIGEDGRVQLIDCIEFSPLIRCVDIASDLAFLEMDLLRMGRGDLAGRLVERVRGSDLDLPDWVVRLYRAHRALVRAKVESLSRHGEDDWNQVFAASRFVALAAGAAFRARPCVVLVSGVSGSGKSTVAALIGALLGARVLATDLFRPTGDETRYSEDARLAVYDAMMDAALPDLQSGKPVVLDGTFLANAQRERAARLAERTGVPLVLVEVMIDVEVALDRIEARRHDPANRSDADQAVLLAQVAGLQASPPAAMTASVRNTIDRSEGGPVDLGDLAGQLVVAKILGRMLPV